MNTAAMPLGIDVSKAKLDCALYRSKAFADTPEGFARLSEWLHHHGADQVHVCMEATGTYWEAAALYLADAGQRVSVINPALAKAHGSRSGCAAKPMPWMPSCWRTSVGRSNRQCGRHLRKPNADCGRWCCATRAWWKCRPRRRIAARACARTCVPAWKRTWLGSPRSSRASNRPLPDCSTTMITCAASAHCSTRFPAWASAPSRCCSPTASAVSDSSRRASSWPLPA